MPTFHQYFGEVTFHIGSLVREKSNCSGLTKLVEELNACEFGAMLTEVVVRANGDNRITFTACDDFGETLEACAHKYLDRIRPMTSILTIKSVELRKRLD